MKASNAKNSTPSQHLECLRESKGITHARYMCDKLGRRRPPSGIYLKVRRHWLSRLVEVGAVVF